jgi:nitroimidazol reductase NimA-like FMN-containing flavoprotein (pyridoxamine 5'-phosphate oxidase superfamily)
MQYKINQRNKVTRAKERGNYDQQTVHAILDAGKICDVGFVVDEQPFVIPMAYARVDNTIILHGSVASRLAKLLATGVPACVTVTHLDGLVLARSTFHHSLNFRSVLAFGTAKLIEDETQKLKAMDQLVEFLTPGRTRDCRAPNRKEINATLMLEFSIEQASAKIRTGGPKDLDSDMDRAVWAGVVPITQQYGAWEASVDLKADTALPDYLEQY